MTSRVIPAARSLRSVRGASARSGSSNDTTPTGSPSTVTQASTAPSSAARDAAAAAQPPASVGHARLPTVTRRPSTVALTPVPAASSTSVGTLRFSPRATASATIARARTCGENCSAEAASRSTCRAVQPGATATSVPRGRPDVTVPVLSSTSVVTLPRLSSAAPPRTTTPNRDARDNPATIATGAASSSGHGVATTNTATARCADPLASHATPATPSASGTNQAAARSASRTTGALSAAACSARRTIPA